MSLQAVPMIAKRLYNGQIMTEEQIIAMREKNRLYKRVKLTDPVEREKNRLHCKKYYETHKEQHREYARKWEKAHRNEPKYKEYSRLKSKKWHDADINRAREVYKRHNRKLKLIALQTISKVNEPFCVRCGCKDLRLLETNHKNGNGTKDINCYTGRGSGFNRAIIKGIRKVDDLEVLCKVCNAWHYVEQKFGLKYNVEFKVSAS